MEDLGAESYLHLQLSDGSRIGIRTDRHAAHLGNDVAVAIASNRPCLRCQGRTPPGTRMTPLVMTPAGAIVGVDIGGTKTEICPGHYDAGRLVKLREIVLPSSSWRGHDFASDADGLLNLIHDLVGETALSAFAVGAHGCDDDLECDALAEALRARTSVPLRVVNDAEPMPLAMGWLGQIGLVAGTGSIAVCRDEEGRMISAGGWGWLIGDDGSAAGLVREAARTISRALDTGATIEDPLIRRMYASLGHPDLPRLGSVLADRGSAAAIGAHAPAVFEAYVEGSPLARRVIIEGAEALAELVVNLRLRGSMATHVVAGGSVIVSQPSLWEAFVAAIQLRSDGQVTPQLFDGHPVDGACRLAAEIKNSRDPNARGLAPAHSQKKE